MLTRASFNPTLPDDAARLQQIAFVAVCIAAVCLVLALRGVVGACEAIEREFTLETENKLLRRLLASEMARAREPGTHRTVEPDGTPS
jgi:hypothetical protein